MLKRLRIANWSLRNRILAACAFGLLLSTSVSVLCLFKMKRIATVSSDLSEVWLPNIQRVAEVRQKIMNYRAVEWELLTETNSTTVKTLEKSFGDRTAEMVIYQRVLESGIQDDESMARFEELKSSWAKYQELHEKFVGFVNARKLKEARELLAGESHAVFQAMETKAKEMDELGYNGSSKSREVANEETARIQAQMALTIPAAFFLSLGLVFFLMLRVSRELGALSDRIRDSAALVMEKGESLSTMAVQLSQSTTEEAASLEETSKSVRSIEEKASRSAVTARTTAQAIQETRDRATAGIEQMKELREAMGAITGANGKILHHVGESHKELGEINRIIQSVSDKTRIINEIVFQTKLLSFNASVEAARAGEHGKGFAVVAEEMAKLAKLSGAAAEDIGVILESSSAKVQEIVDKTKDSVGEAVKHSGSSIQAGADLVQGCMSALQEIVQAAESASRGASEIAQASQAQAQAMSQITTAVQHISVATQQNSSLSSGTANESVELRRQSGTLTEIVSMLDSSVYGESHARGEQAPAEQEAA